METLFKVDTALNVDSIDKDDNFTRINMAIFKPYWVQINPNFFSEKMNSTRIKVALFAFHLVQISVNFPLEKRHIMVKFLGDQFYFTHGI